MSRYIVTGPDAPAFLCSNTGWGDFSRWGERLEECPEISRLIAYGWSNHPEELAEELADVEELAGGDVVEIVRDLRRLVDGAECVVVSEGIVMDDPSDADASAVNPPDDFAEIYAELFAEDAKGHDHRGTGPGGGQFVSKGGGGSGGGASAPKASHVASHIRVRLPANLSEAHQKALRTAGATIKGNKKLTSEQRLALFKATSKRIMAIPEQHVHKLDVAGKVNEAAKGLTDGDSGKRSEGTDALAAKTGGSVATADSGQPGSGKADPSAGAGTPGRIPASLPEVNKRLDRFEQFFRGKGQHKAAEWMQTLREHVNAVGGEAALRELGEEKSGEVASSIQYGGVDTESSPHWASMGDFIGAYLERNGIVPLIGQTPSPAFPIVSSHTSGKERGGRDKYLTNDFLPADTPYNDKLEEAKDLPGLETSEDIGKVVGKEVTHLTPDVMGKMDERYGPGKWIIKTYSPDNAFAGFGIYFPQRAAQIALDARNTIWVAGEQVARYGFELRRDESGMVAGLKHKEGGVYDFGTEAYKNTINGDARLWGDRAAAAAENEHGAALPNGGKQFMAQPAFPVVGVSEAERAEGKTIAPGEGRVHVLTRNGKAEILPHTTWIKGDNLPVVFESDDTRAMAKAAQDAVNSLPENARRGQLFAPDIVKTADGYRVVELNASVDSGGSGYLSDNPFIIDSYVSHVVGREPAHVQFIRKLLTDRKRQESQTENGKSLQRHSERAVILFRFAEEHNRSALAKKADRAAIMARFVKSRA